MNKKFLSAILFGALMVTSTGTFVSCKDYDDDIASINKELTDIKSQIAALQNKVDAGNYVTNITKAENGINVTFSNGTTSFVETATVVEKNETATIVGGEWVITKVDGSKVETGIPASGVIATKNDKGQWVLSVYNAAGEKQTITLPSAASLMSEVEIKGYLLPSAYKAYVSNAAGTKYYYEPIADYAYGVGGDNEGGYVDYNFSIVAGGKAGSLTDDQKAWNKEEMTKKLAAGQVLSTISSYNSALLVRIAPASVDASELEFSFVNTQMGGIDVELGTPEAYTGLLTRGASENGLWMIPVSAKEGVVYKDADAYMAQFNVEDQKYEGTWPILFGLQEKEGFVSSFDLSFERNENINLTSGYGKYISATLNKEASVVFDSPRCVYDAHLHFKEADVIRWGIQYSGNGVDFTITKLNDELTVPTITAEVHYVTLDGKVNKGELKIDVYKKIISTEYESTNIKLNADNKKNNFAASLDKMFTDLGNDASVLWKNDVVKAQVKYYRVAEGNELVDQEITNSHITTSFLKADGNAIASVSTGLVEAALGATAKVKVQVNHEASLDRTKQYYALVRFARESDVINEVKVPFTISIPTLAELLKKEQVVFGGTADGTAVLNEYDYALDNNAVQYSLKYAFNGLEDAFKAATFTFVFDGNQKIGDDKVTSLVNMVRGDQATAIVEFNKANKGHEKAYNKALNILVADGAAYLGNAAYKYTKEERAEVAFTLKLVSPIEQGTLTAKNGESAIIEVVATEDGTAKLKESDLVAKTYAGIAYNVFMTKTAGADGYATAYSSPYLKPVAVKFESTNTNVFKVDAEGTPALFDEDGKIAAEGYTTITPMNVAYTDAVPVKVTVTDVWGYTKEVKVSVKVKPSTAE